MCKGGFVMQLNGNLSVHTMGTQSGIFMGQRNTAMGWSSHSKSNSGLGQISGASNKLARNIIFVQDPDLIDTPIDDRDIHVYREQQAGEGLSSIQLQDLHVNAMNQNSSVFVGKSAVTGMDANEKENNGLGSVYGNGYRHIGNVNFVHDRDLIDGVMQDQDIKIAKAFQRGH